MKNLRALFAASAVVALAASLTTTAASFAVATATYTNPIERDVADPFVLKHRGEYYLVRTARKDELDVLISRDLVHWKQGPVIWKPASPDAPNARLIWAPELYYEKGTYHMWVTVVNGIFHRWGAPGAEGKIVHLTSPDLTSWTCKDTVDVKSGRIIDPTVLKLKHGYRMWYKDERFESRIVAADSKDLMSWQPVGNGPVSQTHGEGPKAFRFKGHYWIIADAWKGLMVLKSDDALHWTQQDGFILGQPGTAATDRNPGQHPDVMVDGDRAFIYYFVHQKNEPEAATDPYWWQRTVIQVAELVYKDGQLVVDREARPDFALHPPR